MANISEASINTAVAALQEIENRVDITPVLDHTLTLNSKYDVQAGVGPDANPKIRYFGVGISGYYNVDDEILSNAYTPRSPELDLYQPIPIRLVPVEEDLTAAERASYRMRVRMTIGDTDYFAYYLKKITLDSTEVLLTERAADGTTTTFTLDSTQLNPTPTKSATTVGNISAAAQMTLSLSGSEFIESINAIMDGDTRYGRISEFGIYTGEDKAVVGADADGDAFNYTEAVYVTLAHKCCNTGSQYDSEAAVWSRTVKLENGNVLVI